ncbi:hypothetical protein THAOC_08885 [Thalassiosira oceanica]|uniref:Nuclear pore protein n=1 Tax=Thalassiosira oceanica TaxID=159749 RepID=K0SXX5_THAOC|nr:hypothetical protein THAOC_08885 [Thalassiosira oceanica]|eukprot:EJK69819.1 hypothetical protein THAOC_08885 [Thalassiosira oceanica]
MVSTHNWRAAAASPSQHSTGFGTGRNDGFIGSGGRGGATTATTGGPAAVGTGTPFIGSASKLTAKSNRQSRDSAEASNSSTTASGALGEKSLLELSVASNFKTSTTTTFESEASAHRMLAREGYGYDSARLGQSTREFEMRTSQSGSHATSGGRMEEEKKDELVPINNDGGFDQATYQALTNLQGTSIKQILNSHHEHCVNLALRQSRQWIDNQSAKRLEANMTKDWEAERRRILSQGVLGSRFLLGARDDASKASGGLLQLENGVAASVPLLEGDIAENRTNVKRIVPAPQLLPENAGALIRSQLIAMDSYLMNTADAGPLSLMTALQTRLKEDNAQIEASGISPASLGGYTNAFLMLGSIVNCSNSLGVDSAADDYKNTAAGVMGACHFFATQYVSHVKDNVRDAQLSGRGVVGANSSPSPMMNGLAGDICAYTSMMAGRDVTNGIGGVWPRLYYCEYSPRQRANEPIEDLSLVDQAVSDLVDQLSQLQNDQLSLFADSTNGGTRPAKQLDSSLLTPSVAMLQVRRQVGDLYERTKANISDDANNESFIYYRAACLAMLSGNESISEAPVLESAGLVKTVEDYMFGSLWHSLHLVDASPSLMGSNVFKPVADAVARLTSLVKEWGPGYFEEEDMSDNMSASAAVTAVSGSNANQPRIPSSGGWGYALPLLATQQYSTALAYLADAGGGLGLLQAAHVGAAMYAAGMGITDGQDGQRSRPQLILPMLLASYSASLQSADAGAALKYLVLLKGETSFLDDQVQRLLHETRQFELLAGKIDPHGTRSQGALDAFFPRSQVSSLLVSTANMAVRVGKPADAAELLVLSGRFSALFTLMNRELATYLNASSPEDESKRQFWFNAAQKFHAMHLTEGRSYVQTSLSNEGQMELGNTFQLLMNLIVFVDRCRQGNLEDWKNALVLIDGLDLLPRTDGDMTVKVNAFHSLDTCVRQVFHHVVLSTMETLCHLYRALRNGGETATVDQTLHDYRTRARLLVTFSRLLNLPGVGDGDTLLRISQLEKNMM